jgi:hypothetical protein
MKCLKCNHEISDQRKSCFYCGAPTESDASPAKTVSLTDKNNVFIYTEKTEQGNPEDLPEDMRLELEEALRQGKKDVVLEKTGVVHKSLDAEISKADIMPFEKISSVLAEMKDLLDRGEMTAEVYEPMALDVLKDYLASLDDNAQLAFLDDKHPGLELHQYMTAGMFKKLRPIVMKSLMDKAEKRNQSGA